MNNAIGILAAWSLKEVNGKVYTPSTHMIYIDYLCTNYEKVYLITTISQTSQVSKNITPLEYNNLICVPIPHYSSYMGAMRYFYQYKKAIKDVSAKVDLFYVRVPDPFCWMPALLTKTPTIMHFVGETVDATKHNQIWSPIKRRVMIIGYFPEYRLTIKAARKCKKVLTNGPIIANKLRANGVNAEAIVSSTIAEKELNQSLKPLSKQKITLTYTGYLRGAKGLKTLLNLLCMLKQKKIDFFFNIIGDGDMYSEIKKYIEREDLINQVKLWGYIDNRQEINQILDQSDIFFFPSLSEGSPRVIIEAMARGVPVISTPVGSLPYTFKENEEIIFFPFYREDIALKKIEDYIKDTDFFEKIRRNALKKVKEKYTKEKFFLKIFKL